MASGINNAPNGRGFPIAIETRRSGKYLAWLAAALALLLILVGAQLQAVEYDEAITLLEVSGNAGPVWPQGIRPASISKVIFNDVAELTSLIEDLKRGDVHPPLYFVLAWTVHSLAGPDIFVQRIVTILTILVALVALLKVWNASVEVANEDRGGMFAAIFLTSPTIYFAATTARGYALAIAFLCIAYAAAYALRDAGLRARQEAAIAGVVGLACGAAVATNYLAIFIAAALGAYTLVLLSRRRRALAAAALVAGSAPFVALVTVFLIAQSGLRPHQFAGFEGTLFLLVKLLAKMLMAVPQSTVPILAISLFAAVPMCLALGAAVNGALRGNGATGAPLILVAAHIMGLVLLSWATDKTLSAPRYMSLAGPFLALAAAQGAWRLVFQLGTSATVRALPALLVASQATLITSVLASGGDEGAFRRTVLHRAAATPAEKSVLLVDKGFGRGVPGATVLTATSNTNLWIQRLDTITIKDLATLPKEVEYIHILASRGYPTSIVALTRIGNDLQDIGWAQATITAGYALYTRP